MHKDHLGSVRLLANSSGSEVSYYDYDVYGTTQRSSVSTDIPYKFTGQEFDQFETTGMYNFRARFYSDSTAIFNSDDPAHSSTSPYGYVGGNPVSFTDPTGMVKNPMAPPPDYLSMEADWLDAQEIGMVAGGGNGVFSFSGALGTYDASYGAGEEYAAATLAQYGIYSDGNGGYIIGNVHYYANGTASTRSGNGHWEVRESSVSTPGYYVQRADGTWKFVPSADAQNQLYSIWEPDAFLSNSAWSGTLGSVMTSLGINFDSQYMILDYGHALEAAGTYTSALKYLGRATNGISALTSGEIAWRNPTVSNISRATFDTGVFLWDVGWEADPAVLTMKGIADVTGISDVFYGGLNRYVRVISSYFWGTGYRFDPTIPSWDAGTGR